MKDLLASQILKLDDSTQSLIIGSFQKHFFLA